MVKKIVFTHNFKKNFQRMPVQIQRRFEKQLELFEKDPDTKAVLMIGEIGGSQEEEAADYIRKNMKKKVAAFIAGTTAPKGKRMGHAGAIISGSRGTAQEKIQTLESNGIAVIKNLSEIGSTLKQIFN